LHFLQHWKPRGKFLRDEKSLPQTKNCLSLKNTIEKPLELNKGEWRVSASSRKNTNCGWMQMRIVGWRRRDSTNKEKIAPKLNSPQHFPPNGSLRNFMSRSNAANPAERNVQSGVDARVSRCYPSPSSSRVPSSNELSAMLCSRSTSR
jgi:hypothetical protein